MDPEQINITAPIHGMRIVSYNCRSIKNSIGAVKELCLNNDFILLQEHWLLPDDLEYLNCVSPEFAAYGSSAVNPSAGILSGRPYGGTAILYRKNLSHIINPVNSFNSRITAIILNITINGFISPTLLASVYMPVDSHAVASDEDFEFVCGCLNALVVDSNVNGYMFAGDFNFQLNSLRHKHIADTLAQHHVCIVDQLMLNPSSFTYVSDCHNTTSWIDHILVNHNLLDSISEVRVQYGTVASDHRPILCCLNNDVQINDGATHNSDSVNRSVVSDWMACSEIELNNFTACVTQLLQSASFPPLCCMHKCNVLEHRAHIDIYFNSIIECVKEAMNRCIPIKRFNVSDLCVAGWNDIVSDKHCAARQTFLDWVWAGRQRVGYLYESMKRTRAQFKLALRYCRNNEDTLRSDALADKFLNNKDNFWKSVKNTSNKKMTVHSSTINGITGDQSIANMWKESFKNLYNMHDNKGLLTEFDVYQTDYECVISHTDVCSAIQKLKCRKACGPDGLPAEAIKYGGPLLSVHLTLLFNMFLNHCHLPLEFVRTTIIPLIKNKTGDVSDVNNYRAVALSNCLSKVLESILLECLQSYDDEDDNYQFGFKKEHSTALGCSVMKRVIDYYRHNGSYVFACFLDLSKAFDTVHHEHLFKKVTAMKYPSNIVRLLIYWYLNQQMNVRWKNILTDCFYMKNGVRQGSVLSPYLFCLYMRSVSTPVINSDLGCHISGMPSNILLYADDIVILSPSWRAQQMLLNMCHDIVTKQGMKFNVTKCVTMIFTPYKSRRHVAYLFPNFTLAGSQLTTVDKCKYLGHLISNVNEDNDDMLRQMGLLFARTNFLIRKFSKCSRIVKLSLFKTFCVNFYCVALWNSFTVTVYRRLEAAYVKCVKKFFGFDRCFSVRKMFLELGIPTFNTVVHNAKIKHSESAHGHRNILITVVHSICAIV